MTINGQLSPQSGFALSGQQGMSPSMTIEGEAVALVGATIPPAINATIASATSSFPIALRNSMPNDSMADAEMARRRGAAGHHNPFIIWFSGPDIDGLVRRRSMQLGFRLNGLRGASVLT